MEFKMAYSCIFFLCAVVAVAYAADPLLDQLDSKLKSLEERLHRFMKKREGKSDPPVDLSKIDIRVDGPPTHRDFIFRSDEKVKVGVPLFHELVSDNPGKSDPPTELDRSKLDIRVDGPPTHHDSLRSDEKVKVGVPLFHELFSDNPVNGPPSDEKVKLGMPLFHEVSSDDPGRSDPPANVNPNNLDRRVDGPPKHEDFRSRSDVQVKVGKPLFHAVLSDNPENDNIKHVPQHLGGGLRPGVNKKKESDVNRQATKKSLSDTLTGIDKQLDEIAELVKKESTKKNSELDRKKDNIPMSFRKDEFKKSVSKTMKSQKIQKGVSDGKKVENVKRSASGSKSMSKLGNLADDIAAWKMENDPKKWEEDFQDEFWKNF
ncbi:uncharacterized protein LOC130624014 isoform X2 [Hydractinia symbiolongicarpus]|uniref:uncharacterized protein LOC130624014 isoform X2 n=1 Tax=Hydractinia symbiolongicarpus TaxID=13093 RepID=UPI00254C98A3|nr:uncharacterized protein LOC130624014 isoform X2 [Hydractinia symbiolongicarpus]